MESWRCPRSQLLQQVSSEREMSRSRPSCLSLSGHQHTKRRREETGITNWDWNQQLLPTHQELQAREGNHAACAGVTRRRGPDCREARAGQGERPELLGKEGGRKSKSRQGDWCFPERMQHFPGITQQLLKLLQGSCTLTHRAANGQGGIHETWPTL